MALELQNLGAKKGKLLEYDTRVFVNKDCSFLHFVSRLRVDSFRHIQDLDLTFTHPVTVISGTNKVGKTSILLLLACSFERFLKVDSTSPTGDLREHGWRDVLTFTAHETTSNDYKYRLDWRVGKDDRSGEGKRLASSKAWSGLGKKSSDPNRINAKIRGRQVRLIDLERILPGRSFTNALFRKANTADVVRLNPELEQAFSYIFDVGAVGLFEAGSHINKSCFLISRSDEPDSYSSFNAASGEEAVICLLKDILDAPDDSLILIDEIEAGFHPSVQRKIADIIQYISWRGKKQFIITTHSPTLLSAFPAESRRFIERVQGRYRTISEISQQAARSKMDSVGYPLIRCYCEDTLAKFLIQKALSAFSVEDPSFFRLVNVVTSGPIDQVKNDYVRHKRNFNQYSGRIGYCAVFDGDHKDHPDYSNFFENETEEALFLFPYDAPEKFLVRAYLAKHPNLELQSSLHHSDHHALFQQMVNLGLATDESDARALCYAAFSDSPEYNKHITELMEFFGAVVSKFSEMPERPSTRPAVDGSTS